MKSQNRKSLCRLAVACLALLLWASVAKADDPCLGSSAWIQKPGPPDFNKEPANDCAFHQMAWQTFLYLVEPVGPGGKVLRFETFESVADIFGQSATASSCTDQDERNKGHRRLFRARARKSRTPGIEQAGTSGILVDQEGSVTLYETYFDPTFVSFIAACNLTVKACEKVDPNLSVPVGTLQLKVSWRPIRREDPNYERFYTIKDVTFDDPQTGKCVTRDVAMVGFHLVYAPQNHPELVWSTFEHVANAPDGPCTGSTAPPPGFLRWTYNDSKSTDCANANKLPDMTKQPYPVTQVVRNWAYGTNPEGATGVDNVKQIRALNTSMAALLPSKAVWRNYFLVGSLWTKETEEFPYHLPAMAPDSKDVSGNMVGSSLLANSTMETFDQSANPLELDPDTKRPILNSCFSCHNTTTDQNPQPVHVTHSITNAADLRDCPWDMKTQPAACQATQPKKTAAQTSAIRMVPSH